MRFVQIITIRSNNLDPVTRYQLRQAYHNSFICEIKALCGSKITWQTLFFFYQAGFTLNVCLLRNKWRQRERRQSSGRSSLRLTGCRWDWNTLRVIWNRQKPATSHWTCRYTWETTPQSRKDIKPILTLNFYKIKNTGGF